MQDKLWTDELACLTVFLVIKHVQRDLTRTFEEYVKNSLSCLFKVISEEEDDRSDVWLEAIV